MQSKEVSMSSSQHSAAGNIKIASGGGVRSKKSAWEGGEMQRGLGEIEGKVWRPLPMAVVRRGQGRGQFHGKIVMQ